MTNRIVPADALVSVVLPTYNRARYLPRAIGSVLNQTYANLELIVADDGSTDDSAAVVAAIKDPRLRYLRCPRNGGAGYARNRGVELARGELIAFQDSDDEWLPYKLERQMQAFAQASPDVGMICSAYRFVSYHGAIDRLFVPDLACQTGDCERRLLGGFLFITPTWLLRRVCLEDAGPFDEALPNREDWELMFRVMPKWRVQVLAEPLVIQYGTENSRDQNWRARVESYRTLLERYDSRWVGEPKLKARQCFELARSYANLGEVVDAKRWLKQCVQLRPFWWRAWRMRFVLLFGAAVYNQGREAKTRFHRSLRQRFRGQKLFQSGHGQGRS